MIRVISTTPLPRDEKRTTSGHTDRNGRTAALGNFLASAPREQGYGVGKALARRTRFTLSAFGGCRAVEGNQPHGSGVEIDAGWSDRPACPP